MTGIILDAAASEGSSAVRMPTAFSGSRHPGHAKAAVVGHALACPLARRAPLVLHQDEVSSR